MKLHNIEQKSPEWHNLRLGKITASTFYKLLGTDVIRDKYLYDRAAEIVTGERCDADEACGGIHIERGLEYEPVARDRYVTATFSEVKEVGFISLSAYVGCSPDGLVGDDGLIEIKVPDSNNYFRHVIEIQRDGILAVPSEHFWQMQFCIYVTSRAWCDYVLYNPKHAINNKDLFIFRVERDIEAQKRIESILAESITKIKTYVSQYYG